MSNMDVYTFGEILTTFRKQHHISQNDLATKLDVHRNTIGKWERGIGLPESKTIVLELAKQLRLNEQETRQLLEASLTALSPHWLMPYQRNPFFTGRESMLQQLHDALAHQRSAVLSQSYALSGLGGIGKTQTAIEYAYRYANDYAAVFWISAETNESIVSSFVAIADLLNLPEKQEKDQSRVLAAVTRWLTGHTNWLVIFDNVEDLDLVKGMLPPARCGSLLFTSRRQALGLAAQTLDVEQMTPEEGIRFLLHRARLLDPTASLDSLAPEDVAFAREIVAAMDGLPLALDQAGAYIEATQCSLSDYLQLFQSSQLHLLDERDTHSDHPSSVARTFTLAFEQLEQKNPEAAQLLTVCAFLAPEAIPEMFFLKGASHLGPTFETLATNPLQFNAVIKALLTYSLIQRNAATRTLTIHRLVQVVLKESLEETVQRIWAVRVIHAMSQLFPSTDTQFNYLQICEQLLPHALICIVLNDLWNKDELHHCTAFISHVATYLAMRFRFAEAEPLFQQVLHIREDALNPDNSLIIEALKNLGELYRKQGKYTEAEPLFQRVLSIRVCTMGSKHPLVAEALNNLGELYRKQGKYTEAEPLLQQALCIREASLEATNPLVALSLNRVAVLYLVQGKYTEAEPLLQRVLHIRERVLGSKHPLVAESLNNLGELYRKQGRYEEAEPMYQQALCIWRQVIEPENPDVTSSLHGLGELYREQSRYEEAESMYQQALWIAKQTLRADHPLIAYLLHGQATLYREQGRYEEAKSLYQQALQIRKQALGLEHPLVAELLHEQAVLFSKQKCYEEAEPLFQRALEIRQRYLGPQHHNVAETLYQLAYFHQLQQQTAEALSLYQQALAIYEQSLGSHHPKTNATRTAYIRLLRELDRGEEAAAVEAQVQASEPSPL